MIRIWIVEDSEDEAVLLKRKLEKMGWIFSFEFFTSGEAFETRLKQCLADEASKKDLPQLITLDLGLPGESGLELLRKIHQVQDLTSIPIIIFTASGEKEDMTASFKSGATFYLKKPLDAELLHEVLNQLRVTNRL